MNKTSYISISKSKALSIGVKMAIFLVLGWVLYLQMVIEHDYVDLKTQFVNAVSIKGAWMFFVGAVILMPLNWAVEALKWKTLVNNFQKFSLQKSMKSVLSGVSMAIMTPGRIGEYGGRLVGIDQANRPNAILANLISSLSQNIINIGVGLGMALLFINKFMDIQQGVLLSLLFISVLIISALFLAYFRIDLIGGLLAYLPDYKWVDKIRGSVSSFSELENKSLLSLLSMSLFRYMVYLSQYVMLIYFFGVTDQLIPAILGVGTIFFLQSNLPLPPALSVLARGEMAIFLWSVFTDNVLGIIAATFSLWIINLVIPAVIGALVISQAKIFESK